MPSTTAIVPPTIILKFLTIDHASQTGTGTWTVGRWRSVNGVLVPCNNGLHATTSDNLIPFFHETLWRVEIGDEWIWHTDGSMGRKLVARRMRIVERIETWNDRNVRLFAADCAERVLKHFEDRYPEDKRPREAIEVARRFARGDATIEEFKASASAADASAASAYAYASAYASASAAYAYASASAEREWQGRHLAEMLGLVYESAEVTS